MSIVNKSRVCLIRLGKIIPFILCFVVLISYSENIFSLITHNYLLYEDVYVLNKPISFFIGSYFEYNLQALVIITIISFAIETCKWNKLAIVYLGFQLLEKHYFATVELDIWFYFIVSVLNAIVCAFFMYKGVRIFKNC